MYGKTIRALSFPLHIGKKTEDPWYSLRTRMDSYQVINIGGRGTVTPQTFGTFFSQGILTKIMKFPQPK